METSQQVHPKQRMNPLIRRKRRRQRKKKKEEHNPKGVFRELFEVVFFGLTILIFFVTYVWQNFQIPTSSMENSLLIGDHITGNTFIFKGKSDWEKAIFPFRDIKRGDVVIFSSITNPKQSWIKRCVGVPGDRVEVVDGKYYLDGELLNEPYAYYRDSVRGALRGPETGYYPADYHTLKPGLENAHQLPSWEGYNDRHLTVQDLRERSMFYLRDMKDLDPKAYQRIVDRLYSSAEDRIPEGFYFLMGDNRNNSEDGRTWGLMPHELIHGRAYFVWWAYGEDTGTHKLEGKDFIMSYVRVLWRFWYRTHWEETFRLIR
jgi:signal peptidase I